MSNDEVVDCLDLMLESVRLVEDRFVGVRSANEFVQSAAGATLLDAITMRLQVFAWENPRRSHARVRE